MNGGCPIVHDHEQSKVEPLMHREDKHKEVIGAALKESVDWIESVTGEWGRDDPKMMGLMEVLVDFGMMEASVDPIDAHVSEEQKEKEGEYEILPAVIVNVTVKSAIASDFSNEKHSGQ